MESLFEWLISGDRSDLPLEWRNTPEISGRALFANTTIPPESILFTIPSRFLLNRFTLEGHASLTSNQLLCRKLFSSRIDTQTDHFWKPFIASLPPSFDGHPLSWLAMGETFASDFDVKRLIHELPIETQNSLQRIRMRLDQDIKAVHEQQKSRLMKGTTGEYEHWPIWCWAWLCVNTRCIHLPVALQSSAEEDLTMVPLVDFANHCSDGERSCSLAVKYRKGISRSPNGTPCSPELVSFISPRIPLNAGDEILLQYGDHSNGTLFVEYGFTLPLIALRRKEVKLDYLIEPMIRDRHPSLEGLLMRWDYMSEWTLDSSAPFTHAQPSYRTLVALRLLCLPHHAYAAIEKDTESNPWHSNLAPGQYAEDTYDRWKACVLGFVDTVSSENERQTRALLELLCSGMIKKGGEALLQVANAFSQAELDKAPDWVRYAVECILNLWQEINDVAQNVSERIKRGEDF